MSENEKFDIVEIGNDMNADNMFKKTVENLVQKLVLVPSNLKEAYLV